MPAAEPAEFAVGPAPVLRGTAAGEGTPIVLCHGLTASRRYVLQGSKALERAGHRVVLYERDLTSEPFPVHEAASELPSCKGNFDVDPALIRGRM